MSSPRLLTNAEREALLQLLQRTSAVYLATLEYVSAEQAAFKQAAERWSIAEIAEHVAVAEEFMYKLAAGAAISGEESDPRMDERIHRYAANRAKPFPAPEEMRPCGRYGSTAEAVAAFRNARQTTIEFVERTQADLRRLRVKHPAGEFDAYQNLLIGAYHPERHAKQIEEIKACHGYPK